MVYNNRTTGSSYEQKAGAYLERHGYQILEYNYYCKKGEIDIIARDGEYIVFCEVKYRANDRKGHPFEAVNRKKQAIISKCAMIYLVTHKSPDAMCRFDVVGILDDNIQLIKNAFQYVE